MGTVKYNGLHWNNPQDDTTPRPQFKAGNQFSAAMVNAIGSILSNGVSTSENNWKNVVSWLKSSELTRMQDIVLRLYWRGTGSDRGVLNGADISNLANQFYEQIVRPAIDTYGIRNFQVLNELNLEYNTPPAQLAEDMYTLAYFIKQRANDEGRGWVYLGFPGPGGDVADARNPVGSGWNAYWDNYTATITAANRPTAQGPAYNWLGVHAYSSQWDWLRDIMIAQYNNLATRFPSLPLRYTEYSIPQIQGQVQHVNRAGACKNSILALKTHMDSKNPPGPDVYSVCYWIAFSSPPNPNDPDYQLVPNDSDVSAASLLAGAF